MMIPLTGQYAQRLNLTEGADELKEDHPSLRGGPVEVASEMDWVSVGAVSSHFKRPGGHRELTPLVIVKSDA